MENNFILDTGGLDQISVIKYVSFTLSALSLTVTGKLAAVLHEQNGLCSAFPAEIMFGNLVNGKW